MLFRYDCHSLFVSATTLLILFSCNRKPEINPLAPIVDPVPRVTIATSTGVGGSITNSQNVDRGQSVKITATAQKHHQLKQWTGNCGGFNKNNSEITFTASKNCEIGAEFEKIIYTITANSKGGGSLSDGKLSREEGLTAAFTAEPQEGYQFSEWKVGEDSDCPTIEDTSNPKVTFVVVGDCSLEAVFTKAPRTITIEEHQNGEISITPSNTVDHGDEVNITATANEHYDFKSWGGTCGDLNNDLSNITIILEADCTIDAVFEKVNYTITVSSSDGGQVHHLGSVSDTNVSIVYGENIRLMATPEKGYQFSEWTTRNNDNCPSLTDNETSNPNLEFTVEGHCTLSAVFSRAPRTITIEKHENGEITITPSKTVDYGNEVKITATPDTGYQLKEWSGNCGNFSKNTNTVTFSATEDCSISAKFEKKSYNITTNADSGGTITETQSVKHGESVSITATTKTGFQLNEWSGNCGNFSKSTNTVTFSATEDCSISANFEKKSYNITTNADSGGTITETQSVKHGESVSITATTETGFQLNEWIGTCGAFPSSDHTATFIASENCSISANFEKKSYNITTNADSGGTITGNQSAEHDQSVRITATPDTGFELKKWAGNCGIFPSTDHTATFIASENCTISAKFEKKSYTITTNTDSGGTITETQSVKHGESVSITATPKTGFQLKKWAGNCGTFTKSTNPVSFTATKNCSVGVSFDEEVTKTNQSGGNDKPTNHQDSNNQETVYYTITTMAGTGGTITETQSVEQGANVGISATPDTGFQLKGWVGNCGAFTKSTNPVSFTATKNCSVGVSFDEKVSKTNQSGGNDEPTNHQDSNNQKTVYYTITTMAGTGGTITKTQSVEQGANVGISATPDIGYQLKGWTGNCGTFSNTSLTVSFTASKSCSISNEFEKKSYTITTNAGTGGSITETKSVKHGESVDITATHNTGYQLKGWAGNCGTFSNTSLTVSFTASKSCSISNEFEKKSYIITTNAGTGGSITESTSANHGESVDITATHNTGYQLKKWTGNCGAFSKSTNTVTFTATNKCSISAEFESQSLLELDENGVTVKVKSGFSKEKAVDKTGWIEYQDDRGRVEYLIVDEDMLRNRIRRSQSVEKVVTTFVTDMRRMFRDATSPIQDIGSWDTSNVTDMREMFLYSSFNQDIGNWDTSKVTDMKGMFNNAIYFNQPISTWDTSKVVDMSWMFRGASSFNQPISAWDTSKVENMSEMFNNATYFNQPLNDWHVSEVTDMSDMFEGATAFNQDISSWNTSKVTDMNEMFYRATAFNQDISILDVGMVTLCSKFSTQSGLTKANKPTFDNCDE